MTDELKRRIVRMRNDGKPLSEAQEARIDCALNLYAAAASVICDFERRPSATPPTEEEKTRTLCVAGAKAQAYVANMRWFNGLLKRKCNGACVSDAETVAAWKRLFEWLVRDGIRPPIRHFNGARTVDLPFEAVHARVTGAYHDVMAFRREIGQNAKGGAK